MKDTEIVNPDLPAIYEPADTELAPSAPDLQANPYQGVATTELSPDAIDVLLAPIPAEDVEIRPDGMIYLPEIKYRRILNRSIGPGAWSLVPLDLTVDKTENLIFFRGALFVHGRFVSEAIGEQTYHPTNGNMSYATAAESAKSNCLLRCCKDLGIASELWDPQFIRRWKEQYAVDVWVENTKDGKKKKMWRRKDAPPIDSFPWKETGGQKFPVTLPTFTPATRAGHNEIDDATFTASLHSDPDAKPATARPATKGAVISPKQLGRFRAIARANEWGKEELGAFIRDAGYTLAEAITRDAYDALCTALADPDTRDRYAGKTLALDARTIQPPHRSTE